jgi:uncharacterized protein YcbK (DUF882 family)
MLKAVVGREQWRLVVVGGADRRTRGLTLGKGLLITLLWLVLGVPLVSGVALGARQADAQRGAPSMLAGDDGCAPTAPRRAPYVVLARSTVPVVTETYLPPPEPPEPVLGIEPKTPERRRGHLRIASLRHGETIDVVPWNEHGERSDEAFAAVAHLFRCRVTGEEVPPNERLIKLLIALNDLYDKPLHLISGHRVPGTIDTSPTSQHVYGTAADVRVPGVSIEELRAVALELGARGVGLYTQKQFLHIDFRVQPKYQWTDVPEGHEHGTETGAELASIEGS